MKLTIQQKIKMACEVAGITQTELANRLGITKGALSQRMRTGDEQKKQNSEPNETIHRHSVLYLALW